LPRPGNGPLASPARHGIIGPDRRCRPGECPMARSLTCPEGHRWELPTNGLALEFGKPIACPVCGAFVPLPTGTAAASVGDATLPVFPGDSPGHSDSGTTLIRPALATPRPGEEGGTTA